MHDCFMILFTQVMPELNFIWNAFSGISLLMHFIKVSTQGFVSKYIVEHCLLLALQLWLYCTQPTYTVIVKLKISNTKNAFKMP